MAQKSLELIQFDAILHLASGKAVAQGLRSDLATQPCLRGIALDNLPEPLPGQSLATPVEK